MPDATSQAAAIAFRRQADRVQICLIRRRDADRWGIPKGFVEPGDSARDTALNEAREEAGIVGQIVGDRLGTYDYVKRGARLMVAVYLIEVVELESRWDEADVRERKWFSPAEATSLLKSHPVSDLFARTMERLERR